MDVKDRLCKISYTGAIEDEQHLLFNCSAYHSLRYSFMEKVEQTSKNFSILSQDAQLIWLMNNESDDIIQLLTNEALDMM